MLRIISKANVEDAKRYFTVADYYSEGREVEGLWRGEGARRLGLDGLIRQQDWDALCENRDPNTRKQLTARYDFDRIVGYDFNFHVPKGLSLLHSMTRDERIVDAFRKAVDQTMHDIEGEMQTRVRKGGKDENRLTSNMVWGEWIHTTSRPVDGVPDPLLHAHCFCFNATFDHEENRWKAGQFRELKRDAPYFEAVFHSRLAHELKELGLPVVRTKDRWELEGIDRDFIKRFSRRTEQIEEKAKELGIVDPEEKARLGAKTREHKENKHSYRELQRIWKDRMTPENKAVIAMLAERIGGSSEPFDPRAATKGLDFATEHEFVRKAVIPERKLIASALKHSVGEATVEEVLERYKQSDLIYGQRNGRQMVTSREVLADEQKLIAFAREGQGTCRGYAKEWDTFQREYLTDEQKKAVAHVMTSRDRVMIIRGGAGVGKTTLLQEAKDAIESRAEKVFAFAQSITASHVALRETGFKEADTLAKLFIDTKLQQEVRGSLLLVDEAGLVSNKDMRRLFDLAEKNECRVLLVGDPKQHGAVETGSVLQMLQKEAGIKPAEVREIKRQEGDFKQAVRSISEGRVTDGFRKLDEMGWIKEIPSQDRYKRMASDYVDAITKKNKALIISPTHVEKSLITEEVRRELKERGKLGKKHRSFTVLTNANLTEAERADAVQYEDGNVIVFHQNAKGFKRGERLTVVPEVSLPLNQAAKFQIFRASTIDLATGDSIRITRNGMTMDGVHRLTNGSTYKVKAFDKKGDIVLENGWTIAKDWGHIEHGYTVTSHGSQGRTIEGDVFIAQSSESYGASSMEQFYVSVSRAKHRVTIFTDNKLDLLKAVERSEDRTTATEFINDLPPQQFLLLERNKEQHREPERELDLVRD